VYTNTTKNLALNICLALSGKNKSILLSLERNIILITLNKESTPMLNDAIGNTTYQIASDKLKVFNAKTN
jgi:hypothetical protein